MTGPYEGVLGRKADRVLSSFAEYAIARLVTELAAAVANRPWLAEPAR